jgi:tRNA-dihydrouridine synthase A
MLRIFSRRAWLVTEMIVDRALLERGAEPFVCWDRGQSPILLQLGTGDPETAARAAESACRLVPYDGVNINVGCPSHRVQGGHFGACLMNEPTRIAAIVRAVSRATGRSVSVKCRLGLDDDPGEETLDRFVENLAEAGCGTFFVHARNAWLRGLDPRRNRSVPPLRWERVVRLKKRFPELTIVLNGGIRDIETACSLLQCLDGVMLGRAVNIRPEILLDVDEKIYGEKPAGVERATNELVERYAAYVRVCAAEGVPPSLLYAPLLRLGHGRRRSRHWRAAVIAEATRLGRRPSPSDLDGSLERLLEAWCGLGPVPTGVSAGPRSACGPVVASVQRLQETCA